jgi:tetratricopeptide (TPR) repeat protein
MNLPSQVPLSGAALHDFLDETESALELQEETGVGDELRQSTLAAMLARQACQADDLHAVARLHRLWLQAGRPDQALRVLREDGAGVAARLPAEERADADLRLAFWRVEAALSSPASGNADAPAGVSADAPANVPANAPANAPADVPSVAQALAAAEQALNAQAGADNGSAWIHLADLSGQAGDQARARRCVQALHQRNASDPDRDTYRAWDAAMLNARLAASHQAEGRADRALACAQAAIDALATASPGQDVDSDDWVNLGERLLGVAPALIDDVVRHAPARLPADAAAPLHRKLGVQLARLRARALHARGLLDQALALAPAGRFSLSCGEDDDFSALVLDWLVEAERWPDAARLAFELANSERETSGLHACHVALAHQERASEDDETRMHWLLARANMAQYEELRQRHGITDPAAHWEPYLAQAEQCVPGHPLIKLMRGEYMLRMDHDPAETLRWLEACVELPAFASGYVMENLYLLRMRVHGVRQALALPFVKSVGGSWNYHLGVQLEDLHESLPEGTEWPWQDVRALRARYYEQGLACFEAFFATGEGHYRSGDVHDYSMLCNNLGIAYRSWQGKPELALPLHAKGIAASPFADHYDGIVGCQRDLKDHAALVDAAEQLWNFARTYGYGRHRPDQYFDDVSQSLWELSRSAEAVIWRERLQQWWDGLDEDDRREYADSHLGTLVMLLCEIAVEQPEDSLPQLEALLPHVRTCEWLGTHMNAALSFKRAGRPQRALELYKEVLARCTGTTERDVERRKDIEESLAQCRQALRAQRPWWKFWN